MFWTLWTTFAPEFSPASLFKSRVVRCALSEDSARYPAIPLCPFAEARSAGVLPEGCSGHGSVSAPGAAPREMRKATVRSLIK